MGSRWSITSNLPSDREEVRRLTREAALRHGVNPDVLEALTFQESGFNRNAQSGAGAAGAHQFIESTARAYGLSSRDRFDPVKSADAAARHVRDLLKRYNGNVDAGLAAYNAGPKYGDRVAAGRSDIPTETKKYIPAIKAHFDRIASRGGYPDAPSAPKASIPDIAAPKREYKDTGWIDGRPGSADTQTRVESMRKPYEGPTDAPVASGFELKESVPKPSVATVRVPSVAEAARTRVARQPGRNYVAEGAKALDAFGNAVLGGWRRPDSSMDRYEHAERQQAAARSTRAVSGSRMAGVFAPKGNVRPRTPLGQLPGADLVETPADRAVAAVAPPQRREIGLNARERGIPAPLRANETRPDWQDQAEVPDALPANAMQPDWADSGMAAQRPGAAVGGVFGGGRTAPAEEPILAAQRRANIQPTDPELAARARRNAMYPELAPEGWTGPDYARKQREAAGWSRIKDIATGEQHPYAKLASILGEFTWTPPNLDAESRAINDRATDEQFDRSALGRIGQVGAFLSNPTAAVGVFSTDDAVRRIKENKYFEPAARSLGPLENVGRGLVNAPGQVFQGLSNNLVRSRQQVEANPNAAVPGAVDVIGHLANATGQAPAALGALMLGGPIAAELGGGEGLAGAIGLGGLEAASGRPYGAQQAETPDEYLGRVARAATTGGIFPYATKALAPVVNPLVRGGEAAISKLGRFGQLIEPLAIPSRLGSGASMAAVGPVTAGLFGDPMPTVGQTVENVATGIATGPEANRFRGVHPTLHPTDWATQAAERDAARAARTPVEPQRTAGDARTYLVRDEDGRHAMVTVKGDQIVRADEVTNPKRSERYQTESAVEVSRDEMDGLVRPDQFADAGEAHRTQFVRDYDLARPLRGAAKETAPVVDVAGSTAAKQAAPTPNDVKRETLKPESITAGVESGNLVPYRDTAYLTDAPDVAARRNQTRLIDPQTNERLTFASPEAAEAFVNPSIVPRETVVSPVEGSAAAPSTVPSEVPQPIAPQTAASGEAGATVPVPPIVERRGGDRLTEEQFNALPDSEKWRIQNTDKLTGLRNQTWFDTAHHLADADPNIGTLAFDGDNFGWVNKAKSQGEGDEALRRFGAAIKQAADEHGLVESDRTGVARSGGDEFYVLGPKDMLEKIRARAEELAGIEDVTGVDPGTPFTRTKPVGLTGSIGDTRADAEGPLQAFKAAKKGQQEFVPDVPIDQIVVDPKRFQFRRAFNAKGGSGRLAGRKYNREYMGTLTVWADPADGKVYLVNGHHRLEKAVEAGEKTVPVVRFLSPEVKTADEAAKLGALENLSQGNAEPLDAALFLRKSDYPLDVALEELAGTSDASTSIVKQAVELAKLSENVFGRVMDGTLSETQGVAIGKHLAGNTDLQLQAMRLFATENAKGRKLKDSVVNEIAESMANGPATETVTHTLFGDEVESRSLVVERADVSDYIRSEIGADKRAFGGAARNKNKLEAAGSKIADNARELADSATTALGVFDKEKKLSGPISEVLDDAARQIAEGKPAKQVRADAYDRIRPLLDQVLASGSHTADSTGKGRAGAGARVSESGLFDDPVGDSGTPQGSPVRGFPRPASEGGTESTLGFISTKRVPSTLAGHDLVVSGDKVLDIVPAGAEAKTPEPVDAPPMESLLRAGQSHKIVVPKTSAELPILYVNSQTADTIQSALDGKQSDWAGLSWKGTEAMEAATALREIADSGSLPPTQVHRARSLADTLQNVSEAAAKGDHSVSVVKTERRSEDGTLRAAKPAEMQAIVKHFDSAAKPKSSGAKSYGREATSFGRSSAKAKRIEPAKLEGGAVKPLKQIISDFADSIDRVIAKTKQKPKFLGTYWPRDTHIGIRNAGDLDTVAHEGAHALDDMHGIVAEWAYDENSPFDKELIPQFSQHGSRPPAGMDDVEARAYERAEGVAEWVRAYIMNPEAALTAAPKFAKFFTLKIPAEQHAAVRAFSKDVREFAGLRADKAIGANIRMDIPRQTFWKKLGLGDDWQATLSRELSDELAPAIAKWREVRGFRGLGAATPRADFERLARVLSGHDEKMEDIFANGIVDALNPVSRDKNGRVTVNRTTDGGIDWILAPADTTSRETVRSDMAAMARLTVAERQIGETDVLMEAAAKKADELAEKFGAKVQAKLDAEAKLREKAIEKTYNGRLRDAEKAREKALAKATTDKEKQKAVDLANRRIDEAAKRYEADRTKHAEWLSKAEAEMQTRVEEFADRASKRGEERAWNRAARLSGIGGGLKHDTEHAREAIEALKTEDPEQYARVSEMAARFRQTADAVLQYLDDMGRYSTEEIERFRQKKDYYTPFARVLGEDTPDTRAIGGGGKHLTSPAQLMKRFKGGTDQIENPFVSLLDKMYRSIKEADRNAVMEAFVSPMRLEREMYQGPPINTAQFGYRVEAPQEGSVKIFHKTVDDQGVATVETEHWMFPEETRASLKGLGEVGDMGFVWKFVTAPARMTRWGVVHAPGFLIRNIIRDPFVRIVHTNVNSHLRDSFKKFTGGEKSAFRIGGGGQAGLVETAKSDYDAMIEGAIDKLREDKKSVVLRPSQVWGVYKNLIRASEEQGRLAEFRKAYDHAEKVLGLDSRDATIYAASEARGLMDYAIAGRSIRRLTQLIPFVNPQVQGLKKTVNSLTTPGKRGGAAAKMMAYSIIPEIAAYVLNASQGEDVEEEYWQQPSYLRDTFWNVKIADDLWLRIPKPFELGLPASAVGRAIAAMRGDPHAMEGFGGVAFRMLAPVDPESLLTGGAGGVAGALLNRDIFRDQYVVDPNEEKLEIPLRKGTKNASRIGQLIQQASMDTIDSRQVDFIARSQFGGVGTLATQLSDIGREDRGRAGRQAAMTAGGLFAQSPATAARDVQFVLTTAEKKNESNSDLVEKLRDVKKAYNEATTREDRDRLAETMRQVAAEARQFYDANGSFLTEREQKSRDRNRGIREVREERRKTKLLSDYGVEEE